jgi:hypothetical protein
MGCFNWVKGGYMRKKYTQQEKNELIGKEVSISINRKIMKGYIAGRLRHFPLVFIQSTGFSCEVSWDLAYCAVNKGTVIDGYGG